MEGSLQYLVHKLMVVPEEMANFSDVTCRLAAASPGGFPGKFMVVEMEGNLFRGFKRGSCIWLFMLSPPIVILCSHGPSTSDQMTGP
jgi:hypothetical protein